MGLRETLEARKKWLKDDVKQDKKNILCYEKYIEETKKCVSDKLSEIVEISLMNQI